MVGWHDFGPRIKSIEKDQWVWDSLVSSIISGMPRWLVSRSTCNDWSNNKANC